MRNKLLNVLGTFQNVAFLLVCHMLAMWRVVNSHDTQVIGVLHREFKDEPHVHAPGKQNKTNHRDSVAVWSCW